MRRLALLLALASGCRCGDPGHGVIHRDGGGARHRDAQVGRITGDAGDGVLHRDALAGLPRAAPRWTVTLPAQPVPAIDVHGPVIVDGVAVVAATPVGIAGVDVEGGTVLWHRPAGGRIAEPVALDRRRVLAIGDCADGFDPGSDVVVGCYAVLDARDQAAYGAGTIVAAPDAAARLGAGPTHVQHDGDTIALGREDGWLTFALPEPPRGGVRAAAAPRRRLEVSVGEGAERVDLWVADDVLELRHHDPQAMSDRSAVKDVAGGLHELADGTVRAVRYVPGEPRLQPVIVHPRAIVLDELGASVPGIALLDAAHRDDGFVLAIRLDSSLARDYVAAFTAEGTLTYVWPLPPPPGAGRVHPVGVALADDAVVVFHDGATVTALPPP